MSLYRAFESGDKQKSKSHFRNLLCVAFADGILDRVELEYIFKVSSRFYITKEELEELIENPDQVRFIPPSNKEDRVRQLYNLVHMMMIDGDIDPNEMKMCLSFGVGLGYNPKDIETVVNRIIAEIEEGNNKEDIIEKMMNW